MRSATAQRAISAYGGADVWTNAARVEADITLSGLLFRIKRRVSPAHAHIVTDIKTPHAVISPIDNGGHTGTLAGFSVTLASPGGHVVETRQDARVRGAEQHLWDAWDAL